MEVILRSEDADLSRPSKIMWTNMRQVPKTQFRVPHLVSNHPRIIPGACSLHEWTVFHASLSGQNEREHGISRYQIIAKNAGTTENVQIRHLFELRA